MQSLHTFEFRPKDSEPIAVMVLVPRIIRAAPGRHPRLLHRRNEAMNRKREEGKPRVVESTLFVVGGKRLDQS